MDLNRLQEIPLVDFPPQLDLSQQDVHIWCTQLDLASKWLHQFAQTLSADEQARANRFRFERDRQSFIAGRGILRFLLGRYLNTSPEQLGFSYSARGKPTLVSPGYSRKLSFNVSHSHGLALYAMTCDRQVGIDVEHMRFVQDMEQLTKRYFLPSESDLIQSFPPEQRQAVFFRLWTCKEAYLKATGEGITGLKRVEIGLEPGAANVTLTLNNAPASHWTTLQLDFMPDYAAALAVEGNNLQITCYSLLHGSGL